tara:strand:+ start:696 stop:938 length:243 start_codon:yes stop_codon:yes gene_type:complete
MLVSVDISKGFAAWKQMAKDMAPEMGKVGVKMVWGGTNPDESKVFVLVEMEDPEQMRLLVKEKMLPRLVPKQVQMLQVLQ